MNVGYVFRLNSSTYDINLIKEYFVKTWNDLSEVVIAKIGNSDMLLRICKSKVLSVKSYLYPGLSHRNGVIAVTAKRKSIFFRAYNQQKFLSYVKSQD